MENRDVVRSARQDESVPDGVACSALAHSKRRSRPRCMPATREHPHEPAWGITWIKGFRAITTDQPSEIENGRSDGETIDEPEFEDDSAERQRPHHTE